KIFYSELLIGNTVLMIADEISDKKTNLEYNPISLYVYVDDVDETAKKALKLGAKQTHPIENQFYGDRMGAIIDPFGIEWSVAKHIKDVSDEEIAKHVPKAMDEMKKMGKTDEYYKQKYLKYKEKYLNFLKNNY
ncbi:MAG: VOC family protein, partial [Endomicrobiia bacterium]